MRLAGGRRGREGGAGTEEDDRDGCGDHEDMVNGEGRQPIYYRLIISNPALPCKPPGGGTYREPYEQGEPYEQDDQDQQDEQDDQGEQDEQDEQNPSI
jgi:hypothetical protein